MNDIIYADVPKDLTKIKTKLFFNLTKRQKSYIKSWEALHGREFPMGAPLHNYNWKYLEYDENGTADKISCNISIPGTERNKIPEIKKIINEKIGTEPHIICISSNE